MEGQQNTHLNLPLSPSPSVRPFPPSLPPLPSHRQEPSLCDTSALKDRGLICMP